jgi:radical SAM protein with 4Fe4S-binding SPASM domain
MLIKNRIASFLQSKPIVKLAGSIGLTDVVLNLYWKKISEKYRRKVAATGIITTIPQWAYLEATMKCNLKCKICHQRDRRGEQGEMVTEDFHNIIDKISDYKIPVISMTGGEMFLRKDIMDIIEYIDKKKIPLKINTNGTLINEEQLKRIGACKTFDCLGTSIDGTRREHDNARGLQGAFDKTVAMLEASKGAHFQRMICFTMTEQNEGCIEEMLKLADELCVERILFLNEHYAEPGDIEKSISILGLKENDKIFVGVENYRVEHVYKMIKVQREIKRKRKRYGVLAPIYPILASNKPIEFYNRRLNCSLYCKAFDALIIANNGDVRVCQYIKEPVGNILNQSIDEIWNGEKIRSMRKKILSRPSMLPVCASCPCVEEVK